MEFLYISLFRTFAFLTKITPVFVLKKVVRILSHIAYAVDAKHRRIAEVNLDFAFDGAMSEAQKKEIILCSYENLLKNLVGVVTNLEASAEDILGKCEYEGVGIVEKLVKEGKKIVFATAHYGNWEALGKAVTVRTGVKMVAVGRELDSKAMNKIITASRERFGTEVISKHGAMRKLVKALKEDKTVGILVDQNTADDEGLLVNFFGKEARQTPVLSVLARRFDAAIVPTFCEYSGFDRYKLTFYEPIYCPVTEDIDADILACTQAQSDAIETQVRKNPNVWFWFHKRWKNRYEEIYG
ncbi:MAG: lipid A biosynthesis lauroyl acyltransferase [Campylobacterales bacterium]